MLILPLEPAALDAAIIDLDGTMVDTLGDFVEVLHRMLADLGLPPIAATEVECMVGKGTEHLIQSVLDHLLALSIPELAARQVAVQALFPQAWASYHQHYPTVNGQFSQVYPGVLEGLQALRGWGLPLACLTNKPTAFAQALLRAKGLEVFFTQVFGGDAFAKKKPDPLPLRKTCEALGTTPARTLVVGDSSNDAQAARAAGCPVVLVTYGYNHGQPVRQVDADGWIDTLARLR
ncbi:MULTISPECIES: phosphoglycolate phosphatase [Giesbergeria]|uniref:Phosphoglycolate phosphatase n=1 Tax=Giesbergeria sinuosa TaxID=80883 RepID=A0ABV9QGN4_9BURK